MKTNDITRTVFSSFPSMNTLAREFKAVGKSVNDLAETDWICSSDLLREGDSVLGVSGRVINNPKVNNRIVITTPANCHPGWLMTRSTTRT